MAITAALVKELREKSGAGIMDCKEALKETGGDIDAALTRLREKGMKTYDKKAGRAAADGLVHAYIHPGGKVGVLVEVNCETDFVAKTEPFQSLLHEVAMQVAAANPQYVSSGDVEPDAIEKERQILLAQAENEGKPPHIAEKMVEGRLRKFYEERCLLNQSYIRDESKTIETLVRETVAQLGERIVIRRFARFQLGQGSAHAETNVDTPPDPDDE